MKDIASLSHPSCSTPLPCVAVKRLISSLVKLMSVIHCLFFFAKSQNPVEGKLLEDLLRGLPSSFVVVVFFCIRLESEIFPIFL